MLKNYKTWLLALIMIGGLAAVGINVYYGGEYWVDQFIKTEYMQAKLWPKISSQVARYGFEGLSKNNYQKYETEHFTIYHYIDDKALLQKVARAAEKIYQPTCQKMRYTRSTKIPIVLIPDHDNSDYSQFGGIIRVTEKITNEENFTPEEILCHEFTHVLLRDLTRDNMSRWLHEGIAVYVASQISGKDPYYLNDLELKEYTYHVPELSANFADIPSNHGYGQSYVTVKYIMDHHGIDALFDIITLVRDERIKEETAFKNVLGLDYKGLYTQVALYKQGQI